MRSCVFFVLLLIFRAGAFGQSGEGLHVQVLNAQKAPLSKASIELLRADSSLLKLAIADSQGRVRFERLPVAPYLLHASLVGYTSSFVAINSNTGHQIITLHAGADVLGAIVVRARRAPLIEFSPDKIVVNLEASITNTGSTVLETLEKLPGVTVDKDGNISLKGRSGVTVFIDGKPTYLKGVELANLLSSTNASQLAQVEIMDNPSARYDAEGSAGVINFKFKKSSQRGLNSVITTSIGQGHYLKNPNNIVLNYQAGKMNLFLNYSYSTNEYFSKNYALRTYYKPDGSVSSFLEQDMFLPGKNYTHNLRTGIDVALSKATTIGLTLSGVMLNRTLLGNNPSVWINPSGQKDSVIFSATRSHTDWKNGGLALNLNHQFRTSEELSVGVNLLGYQIRGAQSVKNEAVFPATYTEAYESQMPTDISILSGRADYSRILHGVTLEAGWKGSQIKTDNRTDYQRNSGSGWRNDFGKSNHFLYNESIQAFYGNVQAAKNKWRLQAGVRVEMTTYNAKQLGNPIVKDSSFSRQYINPFPTLSLSYEKDSANRFTLSGGRRIDRPAFQKLNPFVIIYNKYTYQRGNPYYLPQYSWNVELSHTYKNILITSLRYSLTKDFFSQIFFVESNGTVLFTEGNLRRLQNFGASASLQLVPAKPWSFSLQAFVNHKRMEGTVGTRLLANITQYTLSWNNQFLMGKTWNGELNATYNSASRQDLQEILDPSGLLTAGVSKGIANNRGNIKLTVRDIFYTNWVRGLTQLPTATELFRVNADTRFVMLSFTWRMGRSFKTSKRTESAAEDEIKRINNN